MSGRFKQCSRLSEKRVEEFFFYFANIAHWEKKWRDFIRMIRILVNMIVKADMDS